MRGQTTGLRQFHGSTPTGAYDKTDYTYDAAGQALTDVGPLDSATSITSSAAQAVTWTKSYDLMGDVVQQTDPDTGTSSSVYDDDKEVTQATDARPNRAGEVDTAYDVLGRVTGTTGWDANGQATPLTSRTYDDVAKGQPTSVTAYENGNAAYTTTVTGYTTAYQPTGSTINIPAGAYGNASKITYTTADAYTAVQDLLDTAKITTTGTGSLIPDETLYYAYNGIGLPIGVGGTDAYTSWIDYSPLGQVERTTQGIKPQQVVTTNNWDLATGNLLSYSNNKEDADAAVDSVSYTYNDAGQITSTSDVQDGGGTAQTDTQCYTYDYLARLTTAWTDTGGTHTAASPSLSGIGGCNNATPQAANLGGPAPYWQSYTYDLTGNRTSKTAHDTTGDTTQTYTYDADGNPTSIDATTNGQNETTQNQTLTWNTQGDLTTLTAGPATDPTHRTSYHYDADGNLTARTDDGTTTIYLGTDELTLNAAGTITSANRSYTVTGAPTTIAPPPPAPPEQNATTNSPTSKAPPPPTSPPTPSPSHAAPTHPSAKPAPPQPDTWPGDKGYISGTNDPTTGLTNLGAREYDPTLGRFLNPDPLRSTTDSQQWNGYAYADNTRSTAAIPQARYLRTTSSDTALAMPEI